MESLRTAKANGTSKQKCDALRLLKTLDPEAIKSAIPMVFSFLKDKHPDVRFQAVGVLGHVADLSIPHIGPALIEYLSDEDAGVRQETVQALGHAAYSAAAPSIAGLLQNDPNDMVRVFASEALGYLGDPSVLPALYKALKDPFDWVVSDALSSIGLLGNNQTLLLLQQQKQTFESETFNPRIPLEYWIACYRLGEPSSFSMILQHLQNQNMNADIAAIFTNTLDFLATYQTPKAFAQDGVLLVPILRAWQNLYSGSQAALIKKIETCSTQNMRP